MWWDLKCCAVGLIELTWTVYANAMCTVIYFGWAWSCRNQIPNSLVTLCCRLFLALVMVFCVRQTRGIHVKGSSPWSICLRIHFSSWSVSTLSNCIYFLGFKNIKCDVLLQVSKLYEVVPPILTELGKVMWYQIYMISTPFSMYSSWTPFFVHLFSG